ncbi:MAG: hypothetical protein ACJAZM_001638 [Cyclobacteriaceae bacterium]|jgi:hypothetical protein
MKQFLEELSRRNSALYIFGLISLIGAVCCTLLIFATDTQILGINAWVKPTKFYLSTVFFAWTMGWLCHYLKRQKTVAVYNFVVIAVLAFELVYITIQASKGELSHFNFSSPYYGLMFAMMGLTISIMTLYTAIIAFFFFWDAFPQLSSSYLWGIRLGLVCFVIFAFEGGLIASNLGHTVGSTDDEPGIWFVNWSVSHGDLRIAHFIGMHGLQILPLIGYYFLDRPKLVLAMAICYMLLASFILWQALQGIPLLG